MAFFKSAEDKAEVAAKKQEKLLKKYGVSTLSDPDDMKSVQKIAEELVGTGMIEFGAALGGASEKDISRVQMYYQRAILEQNFIMIRQLDRISNLLRRGLEAGE